MPTPDGAGDANAGEAAEKKKFAWSLTIAATLVAFEFISLGGLFDLLLTMPYPYPLTLTFGMLEHFFRMVFSRSLGRDSIGVLPRSFPGHSPRLP